MRDTAYATEIATAAIGEQRIERIAVKGFEGRHEIRFSWWPDGKLAMRPLDIPETELLPLIREAIEKGVFSTAFLRELHALLYDARPASPEQ